MCGVARLTEAVRAETPEKGQCGWNAVEEEEARRGCSRKRGPDPTRAQRSGQRYYYKSNKQTRKQASRVTFLKAQRPILAALQEKMGSWRDGLWEPEDLLGSHCGHAGRDGDA